MNSVHLKTSNLFERLGALQYRNNSLFLFGSDLPGFGMHLLVIIGKEVDYEGNGLSIKR